MNCKEHAVNMQLILLSTFEKQQIKHFAQMC